MQSKLPASSVTVGTMLSTDSERGDRYLFSLLESCLRHCKNQYEDNRSPGDSTVALNVYKCNPT
jgi:predicted GNAT family N-acyltransferase